MKNPEPPILHMRREVRVVAVSVLGLSCVLCALTFMHHTSAVVYSSNASQKFVSGSSLFSRAPLLFNRVIVAPKSQNPSLYSYIFSLMFADGFLELCGNPHSRIYSPSPHPDECGLFFRLVIFASFFFDFSDLLSHQMSGAVASPPQSRPSTKARERFE